MINLLSAKGRLLILKLMRFGALTLIFYKNIYLFNENLYSIAILSLLIIITGINDIIRERFLRKNKSIAYYLSFILSNIICTYFYIKFRGSEVDIYNLVLLIDLLMFNEKIPSLLLVINFVAFSISYKIPLNSENNITLIKIFFNYVNIFIIVFILRSIFGEKLKANKLNEELMNTNAKLKTYSEKIEELTISKERTRIAQELHDSIGHSLIALNMNLEYAGNIIDLNPEKTKEVIEKSYNISKKCIANLREVVNVLKDDFLVGNLHKSIDELFNDFRKNEKYKFNLKIDDDIEDESQEIKICIYKTVMEAITNGIKHGNAEIFNIEIIKEDNIITLSISNNGLGVISIKKSNGIKGIEDRIKKLGGTVEFFYKNELGFAIYGEIPIKKKVV